MLVVKHEPQTDVSLISVEENSLYHRSGREIKIMKEVINWICRPH